MRKSVLIISLTPVASEPRVIRQAEYFLSKGFKVCIAGFPGKDCIDARWGFIDLSSCSKKGRPRYFIIYMSLFIMLGFISRMFLRIYCNIYYSAILKILVPYHTSIVVCNDYFTAPLGWELHKLHKSLYVVDIHEHAITQGKTDNVLKNIKWIFYRNYIHALQKYYLPRSSFITVVSDGIREDLEKVYRLSNKMVTVRSMPFFVPQKYNPLRSNPEEIRLLYHGLICPNRGLEMLIQSLAHCRKEFTLVFRGAGDKNYVKNLERMADENGVANRVTFEEPVPFNLIIPKASESDIGIFTAKDTSLQRRYALPNKFFEYIMAGLVLCISDLPEMAAIVRKYDLGLIMTDHSPQNLAELLNSLNVDKINYHKQQSLKAARELCWERESQKLDIILAST